MQHPTYMVRKTAVVDIICAQLSVDAHLHKAPRSSTKLPNCVGECTTKCTLCACNHMNMLCLRSNAAAVRSWLETCWLLNCSTSSCHLRCAILCAGRCCTGCGCDGVRMLAFGLPDLQCQHSHTSLSVTEIMYCRFGKINLLIQATCGLPVLILYTHTYAPRLQETVICGSTMHPCSSAPHAHPKV